MLFSGEIYPHSMPYQLCRGTVAALFWPTTRHSHTCRCATSFGLTGLVLEGPSWWASRLRAGPARSWCAYLQLCQEIWKCKCILVFVAPLDATNMTLVTSNLPFPSYAEGDWRDRARGPVCWNFLSAPLRGKPRLPQPSLLHLYLCHYDWWRSGALSGRAEPHCQVQIIPLIAFLLLLLFPFPFAVILIRRKLSL